MFATVHEYIPLSGRLAMITATFSGGNLDDRGALDASLRSTLGASVTPVKGSFRWVEPSHKGTAVGYVFASREVLAVAGEEPDTSRFHKVNANLYMDVGDESCWQMREGAGGKFLTRSGEDDLREVLESSRQSPTGSTPRMASIARASADVHELVAFVTEGSSVAEMDYGVCVGRGDGASLVLSTLQEGAVVPVPDSHIVSVFEMGPQGRPAVNVNDARRVIASRQTAALTPFDRSQNPDFDASQNPTALTPTEYWKLAYRVPDYVEKILKQVDEMAAL